ncbi:type II toxin-antitoxin system Phd/YefM family antitoxin [Azospirillum formosense]|nr:type II toxin-antitoxin system Phd/YefM family antitoxin [Azospirillum formosense]
MSARDAKNGFGKQIDLARAEPVAVEKYGRTVVIVMAVEEYERLSGTIEKQRSAATPAKGKGATA